MLCPCAAKGRSKSGAQGRAPPGSLFLWTRWDVCAQEGGGGESFAQSVLYKQISGLRTNFVQNSCDVVCYQGNAFSWLGSVLPLLFLVPGLEEAIITMLCFALLTLSQKALECQPWEGAAPGRGDTAPGTGPALAASTEQGQGQPGGWTCVQRVQVVF